MKPVFLAHIPCQSELPVSPMRFQKNTVAQLKQDKSQPTLNIPIYRHVGSWLIRFGYQERNLDACFCHRFAGQSSPTD